MKKTFALAIMVGALALSGCTKANVDTSNEIVISCVHLGYGVEWLKTLMDAYTEKTGIEFFFQEGVGRTNNNKFEDEIKSLRAQSDIYGLRPNSFFRLLYQGKVTTYGQTYDHIYEPLTDIYRSTYEGETGKNTMEKKMDEGFKDYVSVNGDYYGVPWANGFVSFVRNLEVWERFGFTADEYPRTTDELFEMMDAMNEKITTSSDKKIRDAAPMIYSAKAEYYSTVVGSWFAQYEGEESMNNFYNGLDPDGKVSKYLLSYDGALEALKVLGKIVEYDKGTQRYKYQHIKSKSYDFTQIQDYFLLGDAALCVNGTWLEFENPLTLQKRVDYIKIPLVSSIVDKLSKTYTDLELRELVSFIDSHPEVGDNEGAPMGFNEEDIERVRNSRNTGSYVRTDYDHLFVVPSWSSKKEMAKDFLKWMYSDEALQLFYNQMNGHHLPATLSNGDYDSTQTTFSGFRESCNKVFKEGKFCNYLIGTSKAKIFSVAGVLSNLSNSSERMNGSCCDWLVDGYSPEYIYSLNQDFMEKSWDDISKKL